MRRQIANSRRSPRSAFTLLELLVVLAIIAIIVSLTLAAVQGILTSQDKKNTELTVKRLDEAIKAQMRAVIQQANEIPIPPSVMAIANNDPRRAKVIWIKLQLKRNFPMTFREALWPWAVDGNPTSTYPPPAGGYPAPILMAPLPNSPNFGTGAASPLTPNDLPPLKAFVDAISSVASSTGQIQGAGYYSPDEASHLLYISLSIERRGTKFVPEQQLGPAAIYQDPSGQGSLRGFKDAWDQPIVFFRWPTDFPDNRAVTTGDPQDPEGTLQDSKWNNAANWAAPTGLVYLFEQLCHPIHSTAANLPVAFYCPPAIVSGGPNKRLGLLMTPSNPLLSPNFGMALDAADPSGANENIVSYTLK